MGNRGSKAPGNQEFYCLRQQDIRVFAEISKSLEADLSHYGTEFYTLLFQNHPKYLKYFQQSSPHEFQEYYTLLRSKFSLTCSTVAALFLDYTHKPQPREHLLGYIAMVHRDMDLDQKDMENFMMDFMQMLTLQFPKQMTGECCLAYMRYTASLVSRINVLMKRHREIGRMSRGNNQAKKRCPTFGCCRLPNCTWSSFSQRHLIYGHTPEYWEAKRRHWIVQRTVWASTDVEGPSQKPQKDTTKKRNIVNSSVSSFSGDSSPSDESCVRVIKEPNSMSHEWWTSDQEMSEKITKSNRQVRKERQPFMLSKDDTADTEKRIASTRNDLQSEGNIRNVVEPGETVIQALKTSMKTTNSGKDTDFKADRQTKQSNRRNLRRVSIANSTPRERRRQSLQKDPSLESHSHNIEELKYPRTRRLTIQSDPRNHHNSSETDVEGRNFRSDLLKSLSVATNGMNDRGTSISNVSSTSGMLGGIDRTGSVTYYDGQRFRTSFSPRNKPRTSIISTAGSGGRANKIPKRVSISNAHWTSSKESD
ncbi:uncharacterized protein LOC124294510 [Neodiprion lecontei]|uniref:Uncharacterized protein LOC124294510 n=1 Tax=Neodiprion lecontei TaxID=441921 RepID=A0ABM3G6E1_NEOLC|nr:uncharacterized protein LOC124294510 [Neodiprion lecontei]